MPELELTEAMIGPARDRRTLAYLEAVMLWPHDPERRTTALATSGAVFIRDELSKLATARQGSTLTFETDHLLAIINQLAQARPVSDLQGAAREPFKRGVLAGMIMLEVMLPNPTGRPRSLQQVKSALIGRLAGMSDFQRLSASTMENLIWQVYRPVAHLWAASCMAMIAGSPFPCRLHELPGWLGMVEQHRLDGLQWRTGRGTTLLDPDRTWSFPPALRIVPRPFGSRS